MAVVTGPEKDQKFGPPLEVERMQFLLSSIALFFTQIRNKGLAYVSSGYHEKCCCLWLSAGKHAKTKNAPHFADHRDWSTLSFCLFSLTIFPVQTDHSIPLQNILQGNLQLRLAS